MKSYKVSIIAALVLFVAGAVGFQSPSVGIGVSTQVAPGLSVGVGTAVPVGDMGCFSGFGIALIEADPDNPMVGERVKISAEMVGDMGEVKWSHTISNFVTERAEVVDRITYKIYGRFLKSGDQAITVKMITGGQKDGFEMQDEQTVKINVQNTIDSRQKTGATVKVGYEREQEQKISAFDILKNQIVYAQGGEVYLGERKIYELNEEITQIKINCADKYVLIGLVYGNEGSFKLLKLDSNLNVLEERYFGRGIKLTEVKFNYVTFELMGKSETTKIDLLSGKESVYESKNLRFLDNQRFVGIKDNKLYISEKETGVTAFNILDAKDDEVVIKSVEDGTIYLKFNSDLKIIENRRIGGMWIRSARITDNKILFLSHGRIEKAELTYNSEKLE